ncbi:hypothetical protein ED28_17220 [[Pantoea] beijingensis]|uniref:Peptidase inhibitor I78 family protein n=1 Tax=[Pantoea] beijingensis TaxID=1324864 RepID=A0A443I983_9GAMM|nr:MULTISPECIES: I78 family peptidase inhibitor [Erwiniaceae]RWR00603.1 hypothetical protein ED28_17220 [[Pantoea] beijingensis]
MKFYGKVLTVAALFTLAACSTARQDSAAQAVESNDDMCGASHYQGYVGKPLSSLDSVRFAVPMRAIPHDSVVTMDFNMKRVNFMGDRAGNISRVYCG